MDEDNLDLDESTNDLFNDETILIRSEYHQHHGRQVYVNSFSRVVEQYLNKRSRLLYQSGDLFIDFHNDKSVDVHIGTNARERHVYYFHEFRGYNGEHDPNIGFEALYAALDALAGIGRASKITLVTPYFAYLRGDWAPEARMAIPAKYHATFTEVAGLTKLKHGITFDMHSPQEISFWDKVRFDNLPFAPVVAARFKDIDGDIATVALDSGGVKRAKNLAKSLARRRDGDYIPTILIDKYRPKDGVAEVHNVIGEPEGKICIALEDIIDTGGTAAEGARALYGKGAKKVYVCATHGVFSTKYNKEMDTFEDPIDILTSSEAKIIISDTIPQPEGFLERNKSLIEVLSVAPMVANVVHGIEKRESISSLYK